jgi:hypothetical protein
MEAMRFLQRCQSYGLRRLRALRATNSKIVAAWREPAHFLFPFNPFERTHVRCYKLKTVGVEVTRLISGRDAPLGRPSRPQEPDIAARSLPQSETPHVVSYDFRMGEHSRPRLSC